MNIDGGTWPRRGLSQRDSASKPTSAPDAISWIGCRCRRSWLPASAACSSPYSTRRLRPTPENSAKRSRLEAAAAQVWSACRHRVSNESASAGQVAAPTATLARDRAAADVEQAVQSARPCSPRARRGCARAGAAAPRRNRIRRCAPPSSSGRNSPWARLDRVGQRFDQAMAEQQPELAQQHAQSTSRPETAPASSPCSWRKKASLQCVAVQRAEIPGGVATRSADNATTAACGQRPSAGEVKPVGSSP